MYYQTKTDRGRSGEWCSVFVWRAVLSAPPSTLFWQYNQALSTMYYPDYHLILELNIQQTCRTSDSFHYGCLAASAELSTVWWTITPTITCCSCCECSQGEEFLQNSNQCCGLIKPITGGVFNHDLELECLRWPQTHDHMLHLITVYRSTWTSCFNMMLQLCAHHVALSFLFSPQSEFLFAGFVEQCACVGMGEYILEISLMFRSTLPFSSSNRPYSSTRTIHCSYCCPEPKEIGDQLGCPSRSVALKTFGQDDSPKSLQSAPFVAPEQVCLSRT